MGSPDVALPATRDCHRIVAEVLRSVLGEMTAALATYRWLLVIEAGENRHSMSTSDLAVCDEARRTVGPGYFALGDRKEPHGTQPVLRLDS